MSAAFPIAASRGFVEVAGTRLSYLDWGGDGPPAVLLHGITSSAATLWRVAPAVAALGYRPIALDMPGHGESAVSRAHDIDSIAGLVGGAIGALGLADVLLLGHSWGGATALALAGGDHGAREALARVVLVDPALAMDPERGSVMLPGYLEGVGTAAVLGLPAIRERNPQWSAADLHWKAAAMEQCRADQVAGFFLPPAPWSLVERLGRVAVPLLVLVAAPEFSVIPLARLAEVRAALAPGRGEVVVVPGTNHNMFRGPGYEPTMAALLAWLAAG